MVYKRARKAKVHGSGEQPKKKKRISLLSSAPLPSGSLSSTFGKKAVGDQGKRLGNVVKSIVEREKFGGTEEDYEKVTAAIEKQLIKNAQAAAKANEKLEKQLIESQKKVDIEEAKTKSKKRKAPGTKYKRECGSRKVVQVRGHARCAGRKKK